VIRPSAKKQENPESLRFENYYGNLDELFTHMLIAGANVGTVALPFALFRYSDLCHRCLPDSQNLHAAQPAKLSKSRH